MRIWSLNSRRCSTVKFGALAGLSLLAALPAIAAPTRSLAPNRLVARIQSEIRQHASTSFDSLLSHWQSEYGTRAVPALVRIARQRSISDADRYIALMGVAKIGGRGSASLINSFLRDRSWMIRDGALRALSALGTPTRAVLPLLKDPALVVRLEAVRSVETLTPPGSTQALVSTLRDPRNYHGGRAQWIPQHALEAIEHLEARGLISKVNRAHAASELVALMAHPKDPALKPLISATVRILGVPLAR